MRGRQAAYRPQVIGRLLTISTIRVMRTAAQHAGDEAEASVAAYLVGLGWRVLASHVRVGRAEIDLIGIDPGPPPALVAVEVRWRSRRDFGLPEETVDGRKRLRLHRAAFALRSVSTLPNGTALPVLPMRFDLVVVEPGDRLRHHRHGA
jgi:Holliday junction resolvase-like predicted endonuclease